MRKAEKRMLAPSTDAILSRANVNELIQLQRAKMYCLVDFLLREELPRFKRLLKTISTTGWKRGPSGEFPALEASGWTIAQLDESFRKFISRD
ncbi:MAG: hypothetical protein ACYTFG_08380 [Planctomycetota bacterium]|jgi:hypothetical protein